MTVTTETKLDTIPEQLIANSQLMAEGYNDRRLTVEQRQKCFMNGVRVQAILSAEQRNRRTELMRYGQKAGASYNALVFNPFEVASEPTQSAALESPKSEQAA